MERKELQVYIDEIVENINKTLVSKGKEYQKGENVFSNFETNADDLGLTRYQVWAIYFNKHVRSILNSIKTNPNNPNNSNLSEELEGRLMDAIVYLTLMYGMINQEKPKEQLYYSNHT